MDETRDKRNLGRKYDKRYNNKYGSNMENHNHLITDCQFYLFFAQKRNKLIKNSKNIITLMFTVRSLIITDYLIPSRLFQNNK